MGKFPGIHHFSSMPGIHASQEEVLFIQHLLEVSETDRHETEALLKMLEDMFPEEPSVSYF